jgi:rubrerythrin
MTLVAAPFRCATLFSRQYGDKSCLAEAQYETIRRYRAARPPRERVRTEWQGNCYNAGGARSPREDREQGRRDMEIGKALTTAMEFEKRVATAYDEALSGAQDPRARRVYELLAREEREHVAYLGYKLSLWRSEGALDAADLATAVPRPDEIREGLSKLQAFPKREALREELGALKRALEMERETSDFYARLAGELDPKGRAFFARFLEIEDGHLALVAAEISALEGTGHWFDIAEFDLESA